MYKHHLLPILGLLCLKQLESRNVQTMFIDNRQQKQRKATRILSRRGFCVHMNANLKNELKTKQLVLRKIFTFVCSVYYL